MTISRSRRGRALFAVLSVLVAFLILGPTPASAGAPADNSRLTTDQKLTAGQYRLSPNHFVKLTMQADGNLVLAGGGRTLWASGTKGAGNYAWMQPNGNLAVYTKARKLLWHAKVWPGAGASTRVGDNGDLTLVDKAGKLIWHTDSRAWMLLPGARLTAGQYLQAPGSPRLLMATDGNLVAVGENGRILWASGTAGNPGAYATLRGVGDLTVISRTGKLLWSNHTTSGRSVRIGHDGNLSVHNAAGAPVWMTGANGARMITGTLLRGGQYLQSPAGERFTLRVDGNLVLSRGTTVLWQNGVRAKGSVLFLAPDGNLVQLAPNGAVKWSTATLGTGHNNLLSISSGGRTMLTGPSGAQLWSAGSDGKPTPVELANRLLAKWPAQITGLPGARSDLTAVSRGQLIRSPDSCNNSVTVNPDVLRVLDQLSNRYTLNINNIITGHGCDSGQHPRGRAFDLNGALDRTTGKSTNFASYTGGDNQGLDRQVMTDIAKMLRTNVKAGLGQSDCPGRQIPLPAGIEFFPDTCTHQHVTVAKS